MKLDNAIKIIKDKSDRRWIRYDSDAFLDAAENDAKRIKRAAETLLVAYEDLAQTRQSDE